MANHYSVGTLVRCSVVFKAIDGTVTDPTIIVAKYETPAAAETTKTYPDTVVKVSTGRYYIDIDANAAGTWTYRFNGTGTVQATNERTFIVDATVF